MKNIIVLIIGCITFVSCKETSFIEEGAMGDWGIYMFMIDGVERKECLTFNEMKLLDDAKCIIPEFEIGCFNKTGNKSTHGTYKIIEDNNKFYILFNIDNDVFKGKHRLIFRADRKKMLLNMIITSDRIHIESSKFLFDFGANEKLVKKLEFSTK